MARQQTSGESICLLQEDLLFERYFQVPMAQFKKNLAGQRPISASRPQAMPREEIVPWLVGFAGTDVERLKQGRPGDLPNLVYDLRRWLDLEPDEPLNAEVASLDKDPAALQKLIARLGELLEAVADRRRFEIRYKAGSVILDAGRLGAEGGRALSYRDASLIDALLRVGLDDLYENVEAALRVRRCAEQSCRRVFFAARENQTYCGHRCANKMASRKYRENHGPQRAARERARYERKMRGRVGPSVKIGHRPRTSN